MLANDIARKCSIGNSYATKMKRKTFIPDELKNEDSFFSFGTASKAYWDFATKMKIEAIKEFKSQYCSFYVFPAIVFYCASFEALLNEDLTKLLLYNKNITYEVETIKNCRDEYRDLAKKIKVCAKFLDRKGIGSLDENILQEYIALTELRNAILHYNPEFGGLSIYPMRLQEAYKRAKVKALKGADWYESFKTSVALKWVKETTENIISAFLDFQLKEKKEFFGK